MYLSQSLKSYPLMRDIWGTHNNEIIEKVQGNDGRDRGGVDRGGQGTADGGRG